MPEVVVKQDDSSLGSKSCVGNDQFIDPRKLRRIFEQAIRTFNVLYCIKATLFEPRYPMSEAQRNRLYKICFPEFKSMTNNEEVAGLICDDLNKVVEVRGSTKSHWIVKKTDFVRTTNQMAKGINSCLREKMTSQPIEPVTSAASPFSLVQSSVVTQQV
jgi:hypothetical protein